MATQREVCGFPIGPTKNCVLPKGHRPATACSATPLEVKELICPSCGKDYRVVRVLACQPGKPGIHPQEAELPVHHLDNKEPQGPPAKQSLFGGPVGSGPPPKLGPRCPGA